MQLLAQQIPTLRRSYGGVFTAPIFTAPAPCGGNCFYCPSTKGLPKSYVLNSATQAALAVGFSPARQFDKFVCRDNYFQTQLPFEIIVLGGSFSGLDHYYRRSFLNELYSRMCKHESFVVENIEEAPYRCSILTVESRPDQITEEECRELRALGVSKVELGVQHLQDAVLEVCGRGHRVDAVRKATRLLKTNGFKVGYHVMLGLPGSTAELDDYMLCEKLWEAKYLPDFLKVYPCVILKDPALQPELHKMMEKRTWSPPTETYIRKRLKILTEYVPRMVRISRVQRYFPEDQVIGGFVRGIRENNLGNCQCVRCREAGKVASQMALDNFESTQFKTTKIGADMYLEIVSNNDVLLALARVYKKNNTCSVLRELHVYGQATPLGMRGPVQGRGLGTKLLCEAERQVWMAGHTTLLVNAAHGAKSFFRKHGYVEMGEFYLGKKL